MKWYQSLKVQIAGILLLQIVLVTVMSGFSLYGLTLRKHDYAILNLVGQLRVISQSVVSQGVNYKQFAPRDYESYERDLKLYNRSLQSHLSDYSAIIKGFETRILPADLTGKSEPVYCNWDEPSIRQLNKTASNWRTFEAGLLKSLGSDKAQPRLESAAEYIVENGESLIDSSENIALAFQKMMEVKLNNISYLNSFQLRYS
ncbi:hypothetical protein MNBD_GAMMA10-2768 [hydrothermal vent metagenome]|uniref:Methyl-accepting chemotaxis protein n=1 Tax=hydrothermal vent metagenome TaxID=652676 RepID=A0A3B0XGS4_9ZZZZ